MNVAGGLEGLFPARSRSPVTGAATARAWSSRERRVFARWTALLLLLGAAGSAAATEILFFHSSFVPQSVTVPKGATVTFVWRRGVHTVTSGLPDGEPGTRDEPGARFDVPLNEEHPSFSYTFGFDETDGLGFFDRENPGQIGFLKIDSGEVTVRVGVVDNVFLPDEVYIFAGDSVRWEHEPNEMFHTVTSGRSSRPEDDPGALFDAESSDARPLFVHRFADAGDVPYFCRPHETLAMTGIVRVQRLFLRGDATGDGAVDLTDAIAIVSLLFEGGAEASCHDALDANDDGHVDISDAVFDLLYLFSSGAPPAPFPVEGADRTEDELRCWP